MQPNEQTEAKQVPWEEIKRLYPDQYVLLHKPIIRGNIISGEVVGNGPDSRAIWALIPKEGPICHGVFWTGAYRTRRRFNPVKWIDLDELDIFST